MNLIDRLTQPQQTESRFGIRDLVDYFTAAGSNSTGARVAPGFVGNVARGLKGNGIVFGCITARMDLFSQAEFKWQQLSDKKLYGTEALSLLEKPWRNGTTGELLGLMELDASLAGNSFWTVAYYEDGTPYLRRLRPDWVDLIREDSTVVGYSYWEGGYSSGKDPEQLSPSEVAHYSPKPDPTEPGKGMSWLTPVLTEIEADTGFTQHRASYVDNAATPPFAISYPDMSPERFAATIQAFNDAHKGRKNAWGVLHLAGGADTKMLGSTLKDLDYKAVQGAGETRIAVAARVPAVILGNSEGLGGSSLNQGNYGMARRQFGDMYLMPHLMMACGTLAQLVTEPVGARLWYDTSQISFLHEDLKDAAEINATQATAIRTYTDAGYTAASAVRAVVAGDPTLLEHSGLFSVQLQPPGTTTPPVSPPDPTPSEG